jgi:hypothetical protein
VAVVVGPLVNGFFTSYTLADLDPSGHGTFIQNNSEGSPALRAVAARTGGRRGTSALVQ